MNNLKAHGVRVSLDKILHIVSPLVPAVEKGAAAQDILCKLRAFHAAGIGVHLHCFGEAPKPTDPLLPWCQSVQYYPLLTHKTGFSLTTPQALVLRQSEALAQRLLQDKHPIFMEGIESTALLLDKRFQDRSCFVRLHHIGHRYAQEVMEKAPWGWAKLYYWHQARLLAQHEKKILGRATFWATKEVDNDVYRAMGCQQIELLTRYIPHETVRGETGMGAYCLYHADFQKPENEAMAFWLLEKVVGPLKIPFVLTGRNPSPRLVAKSHESKYTCLVANPSDKDLQDMIGKAHVHVLPLGVSTGTSAKILNALFNGRHVVTNEAGAWGTGWEPTVHVGRTAEAIQNIVAQLYHLPFTEEEIMLRKKILEPLYNNTANARKQVGWIWGRP